MGPRLSTLFGHIDLVHPCDFTATCPSTIALDLSYIYMFDDTLHRDWPAFDSVVSRLPAVRKIVFALGSEEDSACFMQDILESKMAHVRSHVEVKSVFRHRQEDDHLFVELGSGTLILCQLVLSFTAIQIPSQRNYGRSALVIRYQKTGRVPLSFLQRCQTRTRLEYMHQPST